MDAFWKRPERIAAATFDLQALTEQLVASGLDQAHRRRLAFLAASIADERKSILLKRGQLNKELRQRLRAAFSTGELSALELEQADIAARAGGVLAVQFSGGFLSLGSFIGSVTVLGVGARNSIMMIARPSTELVDDEV